MTGQDSQRQAGSATQDQAKGKYWRVLHGGYEQSGSESVNRRGLDTGLITDENHLNAQVNRVG